MCNSFSMYCYLFTPLSRCFSSAVHACLSKDKAQKKYDDYVRLQESSTYQRIWLAGRDTLDAGRKQEKEDLAKSKERFETRLARLQELPEISSHFLDFTSNLDEKEVQGYVDEIRGYLRDIQPLLLGITPPASTDPPVSISRSESIEEGQIAEDKDVGPPSTKRRRSNSPKSPPTTIIERLDDIEAKLEEMHVTFDLAKRPQLKEVVDKMVNEKVQAARDAQDHSSLDPIRNLETRDARLGERLSSEAKRTASVITFQREADQEFELLKSKNKELKEQHTKVRRLCTFCLSCSR